MTRLGQNLELEAMQACGISRARIYRSLVPLALMLAIAIGLFAAYGRPWAAALYLQTKAEATAAAGTDQMRPGRFYEFDWRGEQVFFAERRSRDDARFLEDVFLQQREGNLLSIHVASRAAERTDTATRRRIVGFFDGRRYDFPLDGDDPEITEYAELVMAFPQPAVEAVELEEEEMQPTALWSSSTPARAAEWQWRLAMPLSTLVLVLLALPIAPERPNSGIGWRMFAALLAFVVYRQMLATGKRWIIAGALPPVPGLLVVHGIFLALAAGMLLLQSRRQHGGWRALLPMAGSTR